MRNLQAHSLAVAELPLACSGADDEDLAYVEQYCLNAADGCLYLATAAGEVVCCSGNGSKVRVTSAHARLLAARCRWRCNQ